MKLEENKELELLLKLRKATLRAESLRAALSNIATGARIIFGILPQHYAKKILDADREFMPPEKKNG